MPRRVLNKLGVGMLAYIAIAAFFALLVAIWDSNQRAEDRALQTEQRTQAICRVIPETAAIPAAGLVELLKREAEAEGDDARVRELEVRGNAYFAIVSREVQELLPDCDL